MGLSCREGEVERPLLLEPSAEGATVHAPVHHALRLAAPTWGDRQRWLAGHSKWLCALRVLWPLTMAGALAASASFSAVPHAASTLAAPSRLASSTVARPTPPAAEVNNTVSLGLGLELGF